MVLAHTFTGDWTAFIGVAQVRLKSKITELVQDVNWFSMIGLIFRGSCVAS